MKNKIKKNNNLKIEIIQMVIVIMELIFFKQEEKDKYKDKEILIVY